MHRYFVSATVAISLATGTILLAQGFALRTGSWSFTMTMQGGKPMKGIPAAVRAD